MALGLVAGGLLLAWLLAGPLARRIVARQASAALQTPVSVDGLGLGVAPPRATLRGLVVWNPPGFSAQPLLEVESLKASVEPASLWASTLRVPEVTVDGFVVRLEKAGGRLNLDALRQEVREAANTQTSARRIVIGLLRVRGGRVSAKAPLGRTVTVPVKGLELRDVGGGKGLTPNELADLVLRLMDPGVRNALHNVDIGGVAKGIFR